MRSCPVPTHRMMWCQGQRAREMEAASVSVLFGSISTVLRKEPEPLTDGEN